MRTDPPIEEGVERLVDRLASTDGRAAWTEFLELYASRILRVVRHVEWTPDRRADCFVYVCDELSRNRCRRLRKYDPARGASFTTWVEVLAHNLCLDWLRKSAGRFRLFRSLAELSALDEEIYRSVYGRGLSAREAWEELRSTYPDLSEGAVGETLERIRRRLTPRQHWLLSSRRPTVVPLEESPDGQDGPVGRPVADRGPDPEALAAREEMQARLAKALARLPDEDRLLVRLRFGQGLTLTRVASLAGLNNAQQADRRLQAVLAALRDDLEGASR